MMKPIGKNMDTRWVTHVTSTRWGLCMLGWVNLRTNLPRFSHKTSDMNRKFMRAPFLFAGMLFAMLLVWYQRVELSHNGQDQSGQVQEQSGLWLNMVRRQNPCNSFSQTENISLSNSNGTGWKTVGLPKNIHQVWTDDTLPNEFVDNVKGLIKLNPFPEWNYFFWTQKTGRLLMKREYPALLPLFDASDNVQRANMIRLLAIHQYGGAYFDLDTVAVKPLKPFVETTSCSIVPVTPEHQIDKDSITRPLLITNNVLLCQPCHPYYDEIIQNIAKQPISCFKSQQCTGPFFISHIYDVLRQRKENFDFLPRWESYELFQDKIAKGSLNKPKKACSGRDYKGTEVWRREMCDEWRRRGGSNRKISEKAYTYHTWFHVRTHNVTLDPKNQIKNVVPHVIFYE